MLRVTHLSFGYANTSVLEDITFAVHKGEHVAIIGESGSGKSTLLKLIYGEFDIDSGHIFWKDTEILGPKYNLIIGYDFIKAVSQEFDLMPFTTVEENIGTHLSRFYPEEQQRRTSELISVVELDAYATKKVKTLSGGQKQRVALAKALAKTPELLLLDEPFSHIDNFKKQTLRRKVFRYLKENDISCIVATHDKHDVLGFADRMVVLHNKSIIAQGTPQELYHHPKQPRIASFFDAFSILNGSMYYPHQLEIVENSKYRGNVTASYFNGASWLIDVEYNGHSMIVMHTKDIPQNTSVYFTPIPH